MSEIRYLSVEGRPRAMGEAHGEALRGEIRDIVARRMTHLIEFETRPLRLADEKRPFLT
jgi:hypothetical protein